MLWDPIYQCNIPHIDAKHKALCDLLDKLAAIHTDLPHLPQTISLLQEHVTDTFTDEERLHAQSRYPLALEHSRRHQEFAHVVNEMRSRCDASDHGLTTLMEMNRALVGWLKDHMRGEDRRFATFYLSLTS